MALMTMRFTILVAMLSAACGSSSVSPDAGDATTDVTSDVGSGADANISCSSTTNAVIIRFQYPGETVTHSVCAPLLWVRNRYARPGDGGACQFLDTEAYAFISGTPSFGTGLFQPSDVFADAGQALAGLSFADDGFFCPFDGGCSQMLNTACTLQVTGPGAVGQVVTASLAQPCTLNNNTASTQPATVSVTGWDINGVLDVYTQFADAGIDGAACP